MFALALVTAFLGYAANEFMNIEPVLSVPFTGIDWDIGYAYYPFLFLLLAGFSNAVNLTDGLDGLAAGTVVLSLMSYLGIAFILWERDLATAFPLTLGKNGALDIAIFCAALAGGLVGFLWYNAFPAKIFMGDTGSMALGGALAALSVVTKTELLLGVIGGIFVVEAVSVTVQVFVFKRTGKRVFLMAPIHHHFELKNWSETQIMVRFWIVAAMFAATGFTIWFRTH
jgi:phospho-N-acetylmuramoyl-pentapeptide-transferase